MSEILFHYEKVNPASWAWLSSFLMLALFFKFNRFFSLRNVDLFLLISLAPGLLLVQYGQENAMSEPDALRIGQLGFQWLFIVGGVLIARLLMDSAMTRRPLLPPNLNAEGLTFMGGALLFFVVVVNVWTGQAIPADVRLTESMQGGAIIGDPPSDDEPASTFETQGPGYPLIIVLPRIVTQEVIGGQTDRPANAEESAELEQAVVVWTTRIVAILSQVMIVVGILIIGAWHFENPIAGIAVATTYLLLPYTALKAGYVPHCLPASLLVWAVVLYRHPLLSGMMVGLASGTNYYPIFLLPLWCSFYWERGVKRFITGALVMILALAASLALVAGNLDRFFAHLRQMFGIRAPAVDVDQLGGVWASGGWNSDLRLPLLAAFIALAFSFVMWPLRKNLATLISGTAALMVGSQFWHAHEGGVYIAWYLPLLLLTIYRPNLEDRVAETVVAEGWWQARKRRLAASPQQA